MAGEAGRLNVVNWGPAPGDVGFWRRVVTDPNIVWVAILKYSDAGAFRGTG